MVGRRCCELTQALSTISPLVVACALGELILTSNVKKFVATTDIDELSKELSLGDDPELIQDMRKRKTELGELSLQRIKRHCAVRMPDYQSAFLGGR